MKSKPTSIRGLNYEEFERLARPQLLSLCRDLTPDPTGQPFTERGLYRGLLFALYWYPDENFAKGLSQFCAENNEKGFYVSVMGIEYSADPLHWYVPVHEATKFRKIVPPTGYVMYSEKGAWAIVAGMDEHALFTCSVEMLKTLEAHVPDIKRQVHDFLDYNFSMKQRIPQIEVEWLASVLVHLYGQNEARELLVQSKLAPFFQNDPLFRAGNPNAS